LKTQNVIGHRPLEGTIGRWEANIKMALREIGWGDMDWIDLALVNMVMKLWVS
jgi:hypothetical protein